MRLFVAVALPPRVRAEAWAAVEALRGALPAGVRWTREDAFHVTIRFLGEQPDTLPPRLAAALAPALAAFPPPLVVLDALGAFPSFQRSRVVWLGGAPNSALAGLYHEVDRACIGAGVAPEPRPFHPHVTIGRVRPGAALDTAALRRVAGSLRVALSFVPASVDVMESRLDASGSRYRLVAAIPLGPRR